MERANSNETSIELTTNELDTVAGGLFAGKMDTEAKVVAAACLTCPPYLLGITIALAYYTLRDGAY
jgi:hypothetical protein